MIISYFHIENVSRIEAKTDAVADYDPREKYG